MSFCRITGKARGLPKPNYFPLLPPISPADAKRCCRITTKSQGLPGHHYIPALIGAKGNRTTHCRVTAKSEGQGPHHYPDIEGAVKPHDLIPGYKYVFPTFDEGQKQQKQLLNLMSTKVPPGEANARYVYAVEEKLTGLVIPAELEAAVRDGDVRDVMLDKDGDTMLVKMHRGPNVTIDVNSLVVEEGEVLWDGLGPSDSVLQQIQKEEKEAELRKRKRQEGLQHAKKIFQEKEKAAEIEESERAKRNEAKKPKAVKVKIRAGAENVEAVVEMSHVNGEEASRKDEKEPVFGHIVQTATGVEFFPGNSTVQLPEGKVVPGRLVKNEGGVKFVPGIMADGRFIPGQVVKTNTGEQFVPGQVVETSEGPKFVPGQVAETSSGPKFVPGQTIETEDGPQFVPGQIIETKAGPTFIPGQIIFTDDQAQFVPGRVVDTAEGPRFVPGKVIESNNQVTFVSGQVVETPEGLKFIAPDLEDVPEGGHEFSVQGFEVTPEELKLLRPAVTCTASCGNMAIDSRMLRQLSEAGMSVGRQVPAELPAVDIRPLPVVLERLKLDGVHAIKMGQVMTSLAQVVLKIAEQNDTCATQINVDENTGAGLLHAVEKKKDLGKYLRAIVASAVVSVKQEEFKNEETTLAAVSSAIELALGELAENIPVDGVVETLHHYLTKPQNLSQIAIETVNHLEANETAVDKLKFAVCGNLEPAHVVEKLSAVLKDNMGEAFQQLSTSDPGLLKNVLERLSNVENITTEQQATEALQKAIVSAVRERGEERLRNMMQNSRGFSEGRDFKDLLLQSIGLARALGMTNVAHVLLDVVSDVQSHEVLANDPTTIDILERLTIMRQFAETKPELNTALRQLISDPELAKNDPGVRELVRHSTALMVVPEEPLQSSADIPTSLLMPGNVLAMEEFLAKTRRPKTLLILKSGLQAVVPKENSRAVLTGQVPYAVLDEKGIKYFEPMHVFSTMKLPQYAAHCFSMYCCPEVEYDSGLVTPADSTPRGSISSSEDNSVRRRNDWSRRSTMTNGGCDKYYNNNSNNNNWTRRATVNLDQPLAKHILDRRLSDWANGTLFINNGNLTSNDSLLYEHINGSSYYDKYLNPKYYNGDYPLHERRRHLMMPQVSDLYSVVKDFTADDENAISLHQGELVEVLDIGNSAAKRLKLDIGGDAGELLDTSAAKHKLSIRPKRKHADPRQRDTSPLPEQIRWLVRTVEGVSKQGWIPSNILKLESPTYEGHHRPEDAKYKREAVVRELVETEEEFGRDLQNVVESYMKPLDSSSVPRIVRDNIDVIFSNLRQIANFHNTVLIEGVKYYANEPRMIGKTFLRLERDFDKHVAYCRDEPAAQEFLADNPPARDFFEELSQRIGDDKSLSEHLKLPIQRINDYQLLLKELVKYSARLGEPTDDLKRALELMLAVPHRANDNKFISNIEGFHGNIHKLGRLLRHDWFTVTDKDNKSKERYLFLFKARILICKVKRISEDRSVFVLKDIIRLPEVEVRDLQDDWTFELQHKEPNFANFPIRVTAHKDDVKSAWLKEIRKYASDALALQEHAADDLRISEDSHIKENTDPASLLRAQLEARLHKVAKKIETEQLTTEELIKSGEQSFTLKEQAQVSQQSSIPITVQVTQNQVSQAQDFSKSAQVSQVQTQPAKSETQPNESKNLPQEATVVNVNEVKKPPAEKVPEQKPTKQPEKVPETVPESKATEQKPTPQAKPPEEPVQKPSLSAPTTKQPELTIPVSQSKPSEKETKTVAQPPPVAHQAEPTPQPKNPIPEAKSAEAPQVPQPEPVQTAPVQSKPVETPPAQSKPTEAPTKPKLAETPPVQAKPTEATAVQAKQEEASLKPKPAEVPPAQAKPTETPSAQVKPTEAPVVKAKPEEVSPTQAKPAEVQPKLTAAQPAQPNSAEAPPKRKPTEAAPAQVKAAETPPKPKAEEVSPKPIPEEAAPKPKAEVPPNPKPEEAAPKPKPEEAAPKPKPEEATAKPKLEEAAPKPKPEEAVPKRKPEEAAAKPKPEEALPKPKTEEAPPKSKPEEAPPKSKPEEAPPKSKPEEALSKPKPTEAPQPQSKPKEAPPAQPKPAEAPQKPTPAEVPPAQPKQTEVPPTQAKPVEVPPAQAKPAETPAKAAESTQKSKPQQNPGGVQQKPSEPANPPPSEGGIKRPAPDQPLIEKKQKSNDMSGISSTTTTSTKIVEESYSISSQHEEVYVQSSSNQFSASSVSATAVSSTAISSSSYQSSNVSGAITDGAVTAGSTTLSITELGKPVFTRTISGLHLEPGETAVFECQLESSAQVTWLKDNKALEDKLADRVIKSAADDATYRLELQHVHEYDTGIYTALAQNKEGSATCTAQLVVQGISEEERQKRAEANAPLFTVRLKDTELLQNTNFRFMVKVKGNPNPEVQFFKDGKPVKNDGDRVVLVNEKADIGFYELVIADVQPQDSGKYSCVAKNSYGEAHCEGKVTVTDEKKVFAGLENTKLLQPGEKPEFSWLRDGKPFDPEERFKVLLGNEEDSLALVFQHVKPEDAGLYTCVAQTSTGKISCSAELSVQGTVNQLAREPEKPKLTTEAKDSEVNIGGSAMLEAKILGFPKPDVKWFHDGVEVKASGRLKFLFEDQESMTLVIKNVVPEDAGTYKIVAKNELGEDTTEMKLTVKAPPKFKKKLEDLHVMLDEEMKVTVEVEGSPPPDIKWYKDGKELVQSDRIKFVKESNSKFSLVIQKAALSDTGSYSVVATNDISQSSEFFKAEIHTPPKFLKNMEKNVEVGEGGKIVFSVKVAADPPPKVKWLKDGVEIKPDGSKIKVSVEGNTHTLVVYDTKREDSAEYSIELSNEHGVSTDKGRANVKCPPVFKVALKDTTANEGDTNVEFVVNVNAYPKPSVKWYLDETEITEKRTEYTRIEEGDSCKLIIKEVTTELKGKYTCKVVNDLGSIETSAKLTVNCKPRFGKSLQPKTEVDEGQDLTLQIECYGCPEPEIKWFKDGQEIHADAHIKITRDSHRSESYSMTLNLVKGTDTGDYEVKATNTMGSATTKSHVHVFTKTSENTEEIVKEKKEEKTEETLHETPLSATVEGTQDRHTVVETSRTTVQYTENDWGGVKVEEIGSFQLEEKSSFSLSQGIVEEFMDNEMFGEAKSQRLTISRGVSIVSLSEDERSLSRNDSASDLNKNDNTITDVDGHVTVKRESSLKEDVEMEEKEEEIPCMTLPLPRRASRSKNEGEIPKINGDLSNGKKADIADNDDEDDVSDPAVSNLLRRIKQQRSLLEEILNKEKEIEAVPLPTSLGPDVELVPLEKPEPEVINKVEEKTEIKATEPVVIEEKPKMKKAKEKARKESLELTETIKKPEVQSETVNKIEEQPETVKKGMESTIEAIPQISNHDLEARNVYESLSTSYFVEATGIPRPAATWYKDGKELKSSDKIKITDEGETYRLELLDLVMDDAGVYSVKISNRLGEKTQQAKLELTSVNAYRKPTFKVPLVDQKIPKKAETVHKVVIIADPTPDIVWLHNGKEVPPKKGAKKSESTDDMKSERPSIKYKYSRKTEQIDIDDVTITANVDIKPIENGLFECTYTLTIPQSLHPHTGIYAIKAKNKYGEDESSCRLDVLLKPEIENLRDITGIPYEEAEFESIIYSNPAATVKWLDKNGAAVKNNDHTIITEDRTNEVFKLKFVNIGLGDGGDYTLVATNDQGETTQTVNFYVHTEVPTVVKPLEDVKALDYSDVDYHIRFNGVPKAQVKWFKDGKELKTGDRITIETTDEGQVSSSLSIKHFGVDDVGLYSVTGSNLVGTAESKSNLKMIQLPPTFGKMLPRLEEVDENDTLDLKCKLDGSPIPKVKWFKDGEPLEADGHVQLIAQPDGSVRLLIENVKPTDCGAYKLVAENPNGTTAAICAVAVKPKPCKPTLLKNLENVTEVAGEPLKLEAKVMAFPAPEIKWFKDGHPIRPSQAVNFVNQPGGIIGLIIDAVKPEDAGVYSVKITNKLGETSGEAKVEVQAREKRPMFEAHLMPVSVVEGFPAKLEVKATGHPKPLIKWTHKGKEVVPDGKHIQIIDQPDGTTCLLLDKATAQDAGEYAAVAVNEKGEVSSKAELQVAEKGIAGEPEERPSFLHALRDVSVEEGQPLVLSAPFIGNPIPDVSWTKDDRPITANERILLTCDGKKVGLEIKPAKLSDAGTYAVRLVSPLGEETSSAKASVRKVFQAPTFTQKFSDLQQLPTYVAKFPARIIGVPRPEVEWYFNDKPIKEGEKYHIKHDGDACCLYVRDCAPEDSGKYRCRAWNKDGEAECEAKLDVVDKIEKQQKIEPPSFLKKTGDCEVYKGMTARFTACATGYPEPDFEWYRGEDKIYPNDRVKMDREGNGLLRLTIQGVDIGDVGKYRLRIFNPHGEDSCESELIYESLDSRPKKPIGDQYVDYDKFRTSGAPLPLPDKPIISKMTDRHLTLSWKPSIPHGPRAPVTYRVEMAEQPDGDWFTARSGIRSCACDIRNLEPFRDYKFRIRVENKYGISDPSPFAVTFRQRLEPEPPKFVPYLSPGIDFRPETSPYFPKDFDVEKPPHDGYAQAPRFLRQEHDTQYGVKNHNCNLFWFVYGYPKPKMSYTFNDEPIEMGGRYESSYTRNGQATLFVNRMLDRDVGTYEAIAVNEHGEARQRVRLDIAEYPTFIQRPDETIIMIRKSGRITARVTGVPYPEIKWYKDWQPLAPSSRIKIQQIPPDTVVLILNDVILKDEGLYSVSARNVAGAISSSAMVHIEENEADYGYMTYSKGRNIKPKTKPLTDFYDLGDELGRGTQGVTYHAVERLSGRNYAAKVMHGRADLKAYMLNELDILNVLNHRKLLRLQDSFEAKDQLIIVLELAGGGELLDALTRQTFTTETEIASYIRQILWGLEYLHSQEIAHLGLTLNDLLLSHPGGDDLKICDFGLSRRIAYGKLAALDYGMPEFVSPEIANGEGVSYPADLWSLGIITYILLSGVSPFKGLNDRDTLTRIREGKWDFREDRFCNISAEARDFISKLLVYTPEGRLDVRAALKHPWLDMADKIPADQFNITTDNLKSYYSSLKDWYNNASCRTWYRRRPLSGAFSHPSKMVYPPGHAYTPEPEGSPVKEPKEPRTWEETVPSREPLDYETGEFKSESHYQYGPDTYLLQLRDVDLPCRLRRYMKVAANRQPGFSLDAMDQHIDWRTPVIRERRRFTDVMDEEIDDERKARINQYGSADVYSLRRLRHELGLRSGGHAEAEAMLEYKREGQAPFLREKPQLLAIIDDQPAELSCLAVGEPKPTIQWFKNDLVVTENTRVKLTTDEEGRSYLKFQPALHVDVGIYKVVARNKVGQTIARTRVVVASTPSSPDSPEATEVSDTEILLRWKQPKDDGHSPVLCYSLQYKEADGVEWLNVASNIDHEFWLMKDLKPLTNYVFRLSARNAIGWSEKGIPTALIKTKESGAAKLIISRAMKHLQTHTESGGEITAEDIRPKLKYSVEKKPVEWTADSSLTDKYSFVSELARGRFSVVAKGIEKSTDQYVVAKLLEVTNETEEAVAKEFDNLRSLRHERIVTLLSALRPTSNIAVLVMEKLQGADILTYFTSRHEYSEQMVATVVTQTLDGLQYLHWRGLCHLDIQPDNIVLGSVRSLQIKIVDLGSAQRVSKLGTIVKAPSTDYTAPEILCNEPAFPQTDIWGLGVLTYVLLSGVSPFRGAASEETRQNITFVRYRFEYLYKELTQEATRFLMLVFKRTPNKRPTVEECYEHRWLLPTEFMIKKRERAIFLGNRLKEYCDVYHAEKSEKAIKSEGLTKAFGERILTRSNSIQEELTTTF